MWRLSLPSAENGDMGKGMMAASNALAVRHVIPIVRAFDPYPAQKARAIDQVSDDDRKTTACASA